MKVHALRPSLVADQERLAVMSANPHPVSDDGTVLDSPLSPAWEEGQMARSDIGVREARRHHFRPGELLVASLVLAGIMACSSSGQPAPGIITAEPLLPTVQAGPSAAAPTNPPASIPTSAPAAPTGQPASPSAPDLSAAHLELTPWVGGLDKPLGFVSADDHTGRMFAVSKTGIIDIVSNQQVVGDHFLDLRDVVNSRASERGLLGLAFHPQYTQNGFFFVYYTDASGDVVLSRFSVSSDPNKADRGSEQVILKIKEPASNHNGGQLAFGPDGDLYLGPGDGGGGGDTYHNGQSPGALLAKILRINVDQLPYSVPADNPFVNQAGFRPEVWAWGLRNPWRFSFDRLTGDLYIADVGQNAYEEIDFQPAGKGGQNYGWPTMEGLHCFPETAACSDNGLTLPVAEYNHDEGCAVVGGYVYRGSLFPALSGIYFFSDNCSGNVWGMARAGDGSWQVRKLLATGIPISSFGEDETGEVYAVSLGGDIFRLAQVGGS